MSTTPENQDQATMRRAPKLAMFLIAGGALGAIVTFVLTAIFPADPQVGFGALFGYFLLYGVPAGVLLGAIVALILDRRSRRGATLVTVEHESVVEPEPEPEPQLDAAPDPEQGSGDTER